MSPYRDVPVTERSRLDIMGRQIICRPAVISIALATVMAWLSLPAGARIVDRRLATLERSYWLHASLTCKPNANYWRPGPDDCTVPTEKEIINASRLLVGPYAANRLYLMYHREIPLTEAQKVFAAWRQHCPAEVEIVPTLVLRMYDKPQTKVFTAQDLRDLCAFFKNTLNAHRLAVYDVMPSRDQGPELAVLAESFPGHLVRVGIQPDETLKPPFTEAVQDTWSGFCHGKTNADWLDVGFGAQTLRAWIEIRNKSPHSTAWDLIVVAWDYKPTARGEYPGYDDGHKNMPLPAGRNVLAARQIVHLAAPDKLAGFSSDLFILHVNSASPAHDRPGNAFYETLKRGQLYEGYYSIPFAEMTAIYRGLRDGCLIDRPPTTMPTSTRAAR
jgi:hypothetical protein